MSEFTPRRDVQAISHLNVVVDDIEVATEFYGTVLGFEHAANADGPMDYPGVDLASFARDAGFDDGRVSLDVRILKHAEVGLYLELFTYRHPEGDQTIHRKKTNDLGGIRHVAVEVPDAVSAHAFIRSQQQAYGKRGLHIEILGQDHVPEEISPFPYKFFYWIDPWGVQWEMEQGRPGRGDERDRGLTRQRDTRRSPTRQPTHPPFGAAWPALKFLTPTWRASRRMPLSRRSPRCLPSVLAPAQLRR